MYGIGFVNKCWNLSEYVYKVFMTSLFYGNQELQSEWQMLNAKVGQLLMPIKNAKSIRVPSRW